MRARADAEYDTHKNAGIVHVLRGQSLSVSFLRWLTGRNLHDVNYENDKKRCSNPESVECRTRRPGG